MSSDRFDALERFAPLFEAPAVSVEGFLRRRARKDRNKRIAAGVVAIAAFIAPVAFFAGLSSVDRTQTPAPAPSTVTQPGVAMIDSINHRCERPLVTRRTVASELGFRAGRQQPTRSVKVTLEDDGCMYASYTKGQGSGRLWIFAHAVDADGFSVPFPSRTRAVQGIGDRAEFSPGDVGPVDGPERATTILRVWTGDLILSFEGRGVWDSYGLPALRQLAESALARLEVGTFP